MQARRSVGRLGEGAGKSEPDFLKPTERFGGLLKKPRPQLGMIASLDIGRRESGGIGDMIGHRIGDFFFALLPRAGGSERADRDAGGSAWLGPLLEDQHMPAGIGRGDRGRQTASPRTDHDDIKFSFTRGRGHPCWRFLSGDEWVGGRIRVDCSGEWQGATYKKTAQDDDASSRRRSTPPSTGATHRLDRRAGGCYPFLHGR